MGNASRHRRRRTTGTATGNPFWVMRVGDWAVTGGFIGRAHSELIHVGDGNRHCAGGDQAVDDGGLIGGLKPAKIFEQAVTSWSRTQMLF